MDRFKIKGLAATDILKEEFRAWKGHKFRMFVLENLMTTREHL